jgi:hypothetical protein
MTALFTELVKHLKEIILVIFKEMRLWIGNLKR